MYPNIDCPEEEVREETYNILKKFTKKESHTYFTSGSTGEPKKIFHSHKLFEMIAMENCRFNEYTKDDYIVNAVLPATSIAYPVLSALPALISGCKLKAVKFNPYTFVDHIRDSTHFVIVPSVYRVMKRRKDWQELDLTGKTVGCGSDIIPDGIKEDVMSKGAKKFHHIYGSTEVPPAISNSEDERQCLENVSPLVEYFIAKKAISGERELYIRWRGQDEFWKSGDLFGNQGMIGREKNVIHLHCSRINPEVVEKHILDNSNATRVIVQTKGESLQATFEGDEYPSRVRELVNEWYQDVNVKTSKVDSIEVNSMNKIVRSTVYA